MRHALGSSGLLLCKESAGRVLASGAAVMQVPVGDNYYAALNSAVFSDGSFVYIPKGVKSAMELSTYFRINAQETGQGRAHPTATSMSVVAGEDFAHHPATEGS